MSRVVYTEFRSTSDQEALRQTHQVRIVAGDEEGTGVNALPGGVYGFTYSPGLASSPLFSVRRYRSYETHKLPSGEIYIIGFATADDARALSTATAEMTLQIHPQPEGTSRRPRHDPVLRDSSPPSVRGPESGRVHRDSDTALAPIAAPSSLSSSEYRSPKLSNVYSVRELSLSARKSAFQSTVPREISMSTMTRLWS